MLKIAITGGVASGKTEALKNLREMGYVCVSSDDISMNLITKNQEIINKIDAIIPGVVRDNVVDKKAMARIMFKNKEVKEKIEGIMHPIIASIRKKFIEQQEASGVEIIFCEVPLLFEKKMQSSFDQVILICSSIDIRLERFIKRGGDKEIFFEIMQNQLPDTVKQKMANFVIKNMNTRQKFQEELKIIIGQIKP